MKSILFEKTALRKRSSEKQMARMRSILQEELTELQRYTLEAYYFEKKSLKQIAAERGVNKSTVWRTVQRAEAKLRRFMRY